MESSFYEEVKNSKMFLFTHLTISAPEKSSQLSKSQNIFKRLKPDQDNADEKTTSY